MLYIHLIIGYVKYAFDDNHTLNIYIFIYIIYDIYRLYLDISECSATNVTIGLFPNSKCTIAVKKESIPCGKCSTITDPQNNLTFALSPTCGDSIY